MVTAPVPAQLNGDTLRAELAAVGVNVPGEFDFYRDGDTLYFPTVAKADEKKVQQVCAAHAGTPAAVPPDLGSVVAALKAKGTLTQADLDAAKASPAEAKSAEAVAVEAKPAAKK